MDTVKIVCRALVVNDQAQMLLVKKQGSNFWSLPGGKLEANDESMKECLVRELREELGVESTIKDIALVQELHKDSTRYVELIWHAILEEDPVIEGKDFYKISGGELTDVVWIGRDGVDRLDIKPEMLKRFI